jgi:2-oxoisovalerate dehydrogenase E1 component beta subunit
MVQALNSAMDVMLGRDPDVVLFGEDVGFYGGVFRVTDGLQKRHGEQRVFDAPIAEGGMLAVAVGMGAYGLRPIVEIQFADYIYPATDQLISEAARLRYRSGGEYWAPITVRAPCGGGIFGGQTHSQSRRGDFRPCLRAEDGDPVQPLRRQGPLDQLDRG